MRRIVVAALTSLLVVGALFAAPGEARAWHHRRPWVASYPVYVAPYQSYYVAPAPYPVYVAPPAVSYYYGPSPYYVSPPAYSYYYGPTYGVGVRGPGFGVWVAR